MSAFVETIAFKGEKPWHGLGTEVEDGKISAKEMMEKAGLDWKVNLQDCFLADGTQIPKAKVSVRDRDNKILGMVGDRYHVLQNETAFEWFQPFIDSGMAEFETAGALKEGKVIFVQAKTKIDNIEIVKGDPVSSYILLSHSHDGTLSIRGGFVNQRVVCMNTLSAAHKSASSKLLRMKHTKSAALTLEKVREVMDVAAHDFIATTEQYKYLASKSINKKDLLNYVQVVFQNEKKEEQEVSQKVIDRIEYLFENGRGHELGSGTLWNAYNAVTEYLTWEKGRTKDNILHSLWFGDGVNVNQKALAAATEMANMVHK